MPLVCSVIFRHFYHQNNFYGADVAVTKRDALPKKNLFLMITFHFVSIIFHTVFIEQVKGQMIRVVHCECARIG